MWPTRDVRQSYGVAMDPGQSSIEWPFTVHLDARSWNFRYEATINVSRSVPEEAIEEYLVIRGDETVSVSVTNLDRQVVTYESVGGFAVSSDGVNYFEVLDDTVFEGQQVPFVLLRTGPPELIAEELVVIARYFEPNHPDRTGSVFDLEAYYNPSVQVLAMTFPPGETRVSGTFNVLVDDIDETGLGVWEDWAAFSVDRAHLGTFLSRFYGYEPAIRANDYVAIQIRDSSRAVSIEAVDNSPKTGDEDNEEESTDTTPTIEEGDTAEFILTRLGSTDEALAANVDIDDPGDFRRGNHWRATPDGTAPVTFAAGRQRRR